MELREALLPRKLDEKQIGIVARLASKIVGQVDSGCDFSSCLSEFNLLVARPCSVEDLVGAASSMSMEEFAKFALTPDAPYIADLSRDEQLELIWRIGFSEYGVYADHELAFWVEMLRRTLGVPRLNFGTQSKPEDVLASALSYKPIAPMTNRVLEI